MLRASFSLVGQRRLPTAGGSGSPPLASLSQCFDHDCGRLGAGEVLLTGDQIAVTHRESAPQTGLDVVGAERL